MKYYVTEPVAGCAKSRLWLLRRLTPAKATQYQSQYCDSSRDTATMMKKTALP